MIKPDFHLCTKLVDDRICQLRQQKIAGMELDNNDALVGMSVYIEGNLSQISISDAAKT